MENKRGRAAWITGAIKESCQALADRSVSAQELNARLTQEFFDGVIDNLMTQASGNRALTEREASQALAREGANAYVGSLNCMFSYYRRNLNEAQKRANGQAGVS